MFIEKIGQESNQKEPHRLPKQGRHYKTIGGKIVFVSQYTFVQKGDWIYSPKSPLYCEETGVYYTVVGRCYITETIKRKGK